VCEYGAGQPAELFVGTDTRSKPGFLTDAKTNCAAPVPMPGIGDAAIHLRTAQLYLVPEGSDDGCAKIGKLLTDRL
jgi:hypothetical protein